MNDINLAEVRASTNLPIVHVLCGIIDRLAAQLEGAQKELALPVGPDRFIDINGDIIMIREFLAHYQKDLADLAAARAEADALAALLRDARDSVEECVQEHAANWGDRLMHKQLDAIETLRMIESALAKREGKS